MVNCVSHTHKESTNPQGQDWLEAAASPPVYTFCLALDCPSLFWGGVQMRLIRCKAKGQEDVTDHVSRVKRPPAIGPWTDGIKIKSFDCGMSKLYYSELPWPNKRTFTSSLAATDLSGDILSKSSSIVVMSFPSLISFNGTTTFHFIREIYAKRTRSLPRSERYNIFHDLFTVRQSTYPRLERGYLHNPHCIPTNIAE